MDPTARYELRPGEWREDPPHVGYGCDRNGLVHLLRAEMRAAPWTRGESDEGPVVEVKGRTLGCPPDAENLERLVGLAQPAPYGRGEETLVDARVRDALQIDAREVRLEGPSWAGLEATMLKAVGTDMGLADAHLKLKPLKLLVYRKGGHFSTHADTEPGLRASLLKGRDRELARLLVDEIHGEAAYLAWLQIREVGSARTPEGRIWDDDGRVRHEPDGYAQYADDLPPDSVAERYWEMGESSDPAPTRIVHIDTPELHLEDVARQNTWIEGLRSLSGEAVDHGPIEVLDGEIVPEGALREAVPDGARLYEATGNEGASIELQYRRAVLVVWRRNEATLRMLARCGGRLALAVELAERANARGGERRGGVKEVLELWQTALETDGGGPEPRAHRLVLEAVKEGKEERLRGEYVERVARVDLDTEAVPTLVRWVRERLEAGEPTEAWMRALRQACTRGWWGEAMSGEPELLRALCERPETQRIALELLADLHEPPATVEAVLAHADALDVALEEQAWRRRRAAKMTVDESTGTDESADGG